MTEQCPLSSKCQIISNIDCTDRNYADCGFFQNEVLNYCQQLQTQSVKTPCKYRSVCRRRCWKPTHKIPQVIPP
ncbi:hypothetical protein [Candidatus Bathycorpusculum sp.]|uniref:hypothetical protein n=1 Tax=Candidatus Bathycorpusculum sp. TaxID=2994959 RepID=UPI0028296C17|nr:hypothetical protein [Candidatus Termitimicrobium sp.]MCL2685937.1 hypothetical protein [Candidatus Termitimicrobium sp.]